MRKPTCRLPCRRSKCVASEVSCLTPKMQVHTQTRSVSAVSVRLQGEALRFRCLCLNCPLRTDPEKQALLKMKEKDRLEIDPDDMEEADNAPFEEEPDDDFEEALPGKGQESARDCIMEVFPHAAPRRFWSVILDALHVSSCQVVVNCTTTAHPSVWLAVRERGLPCHILHDRTALATDVFGLSADCCVSIHKVVIGQL